MNGDGNDEAQITLNDVFRDSFIKVNFGKRAILPDVMWTLNEHENLLALSQTHTATHTHTVDEHTEFKVINWKIAVQICLIWLGIDQIVRENIKRSLIAVQSQRNVFGQKSKINFVARFLYVSFSICSLHFFSPVFRIVY